MSDRPVVTRIAPSPTGSMHIGTARTALFNWLYAKHTGGQFLLRIEDTDRERSTDAAVQVIFDGLDWLGLKPDAEPVFQFSRADRHREVAQEMLARIIDYTIDDGRANATVYRLVTTLLDPAEAPAHELAAAYTQRWEIESVFDELKTHQRGPKVVLRSKSPDLVLQEIWGYLCCHYAIRSLMSQVADHAGHDPDRVSFVAALRIVRQSVAQQGAFSP